MDYIIEGGASVADEIFMGRFTKKLYDGLTQCAADPEVVGFKSIACYRTGLDITPNPDEHSMDKSLIMTLLKYEVTKTIRLADKVVNDVIVNMTLKIAGECGKPGTHLLLQRPFL